MGSSILLFWPTLANWAAFCFHSDDFSCLLLVPAITFSLLGIERRKIFTQSSHGSMWGLPPLLMSGGFLCAKSGPLHGNDGQCLAMISVVLVVVGVMMLVYGGEAVRKASFPLLFLILMVPPPDALHRTLVTCLRRGSAVVAQMILQFIHVPATRDGFVIRLHEVAIEVAAQCSGVRSFIALFITALLLGHTALRCNQSKAVLVMVVLPLAVLKNGARIAALVMITAYFDPDALNGALHKFSGIPLFMFSTCFLMWLAWRLRKAEQAGPQHSSQGVMDS